MPGMPRLSLVEGSFEELASELGVYLDGLKSAGATPGRASVATDIAPLLADAETAEGGQQQRQTDKDGVLKRLVTAAAVLNTAPERELQAAYNLLIHLISQAPEPGRYMPPVCKYLTNPIPSSPHNGTGIALGVLATLFNAIPPDDDTRYHVLLAIIDLIQTSRNYETLQPQLPHLDNWAQQWELAPEESRKLYLAVADAAAAANETQDSYAYLLRALRTLQDSASSPDARDLSLRALKLALLDPTHFDFQDLTALDSVQALRKSDPVWSELLELFSSETYEDLQDFKESNPTFLSSSESDDSDSGLDEAMLDRKMRLLTLASLAAHQAAQSRTLPYASIAHALHIPADDVEVWVIDCIRSGLVEGKLSQQRSEFLIHRSTYRVFGENQWREVASRLETWRRSLVSVLGVIRTQKEEFVREKEAELQSAALAAAGAERQGYRPDRRQRNERNAPPVAVEVE